MCTGPWDWHTFTPRGGAASSVPKGAQAFGHLQKVSSGVSRPEEPVTRPPTIIDCPGKHRSTVRKEHRLEAYATLFCRLSSNLSEPSQELSPCTCRDEAPASCGIRF